MIKKTLTLLWFVFLSGCSAIGFDKGLNYEKTPKYKFEYSQSASGYLGITNQENGNRISIAFSQNSCGSYGLIGPLVFPIIPIWKNDECKDIVLGVSQANKVQIIYHNKIYEPSKVVRGGGYFFPLEIKSITDTAILVVEKKDGEKFKIPFRYQHTFSFDLWPGR
ncbi:MAG: hypothetical protein EBT63_01300 [Proteobacteria bacterium]|nr:hypothetical protein [Pseudomonadota bacterium]NCA27833.1 hypothetical protein [Pseudomonadota bacterium]